MGTNHMRYSQTSKRSGQVGNGTWRRVDFAISFFAHTMVFTVLSDVWLIQNVRNYTTFQDFCIFPSAKTWISSFGALQKEIGFREIVLSHVVTRCRTFSLLSILSCFRQLVWHTFSKFEFSAWVNLWNHCDTGFGTKALEMNSFVDSAQTATCTDISRKGTEKLCIFKIFKFPFAVDREVMHCARLYHAWVA